MSPSRLPNTTLPVVYTFYVIVIFKFSFSGRYSDRAEMKLKLEGTHRVRTHAVLLLTLIFTFQPRNHTSLVAL